MPPYLFVASYVPASIRTLEPMGMPASTRQSGSPSVIFVWSFVWSFSVCDMHGIRSSVKHSENNLEYLAALGRECACASAASLDLAAHGMRGGGVWGDAGAPVRTINNTGTLPRQACPSPQSIKPGCSRRPL